MKIRFKHFPLIISCVVLGVLTITFAAVSAEDIPWLWSSEPGTLPGQSAGNKSDAVLPDEGGAMDPAASLGFIDLVPSAEGSLIPAKNNLDEPILQPDDDGYTGPVPEALDAEFAPSGDGESQIQIDWSDFMTEPQPDDNVTGASLTDAGLDWSSLYYYFHAAGSSLRPRDSSVDWANDGSGGCMYLTSGDSTKIFNIHLEVPHGSRIEYLRIYFYDTSASNSFAWVTRYDDEGDIEDVTYVASSSNLGYGSTLSPYIEHIVDTTNYSYVLNWRPYAVGTTMQLCGLRVAYRLP